MNESEANRNVSSRDFFWLFAFQPNDKTKQKHYYALTLETLKTVQTLIAATEPALLHKPNNRPDTQALLSWYPTIGQTAPRGTDQTVH